VLDLTRLDAATPNVRVSSDEGHHVITQNMQMVLPAAASATR